MDVLQLRASGRESTSWPLSLGMESTGAPIDPNGNLTLRVEGTDTWGYEWNAEDQLTRVTKNSVEQASFKYDAQGRRVEKVTGGVTTLLTYANESILRQVVGGATLKYVDGSRIDEPLATDDGSALSYFHVDGLGSATKTTNASGGVTLTRQYDAWGGLQAGTTAGYAFTGREWDPETSLYYYRARYYDSKGGRFLSEDPLAFVGGHNLYLYVDNNPARLTDPLGLMPCSSDRRCPDDPQGAGNEMCTKFKTNPKLPRCLREGCDSIKVHCNQRDTCSYTDASGTRSYGAGFTHGKGDIHICPGGDSCVNVTIAHELLHRCYPSGTPGADFFENFLDNEACKLVKKFGIPTGACCR